MTAKQYLKQAYRLNELINNDLAELEQLKDLSTSIAAVRCDRDKVKGGKIGSKIEFIVVKIIALEEMIDDEIDRFVDLKTAIRNAIVCVENRNEELLLRLRYIEFLSWDEIAEKMGFDERYVHKIHADALNNFYVPPI
ncbi:MAG: DUF1492 domain-containing protein [Raoultibacter sp.]